MFKKVLIVAIVSTCLMMSSTAEKNVNCIRATRDSIFPYGDEVARTSFCVRMSDILAGFINPSEFSGLCSYTDEAGAGGKIDAAIDATRNISITQNSDGTYKASDEDDQGVSASIADAYNKWDAAIDCTNTDGSSKLDQNANQIEEAMIKQFKSNNLVVKTQLVTDSKMAAKKFAEATFEQQIIASRIVKELNKLKQLESTAQETANAANTAIADMFDGVIAALQEQIAKITSDQTGTGRVTPKDIEDAFNTIDEKVSSAENQLSSSETFAAQMKARLTSDLNLSRQFELVKNHAISKTKDDREEFFGDVKGLMKDAWVNFERLATSDTDATPTTFDPSQSSDSSSA